MMSNSVIFKRTVLFLQIFLFIIKKKNQKIILKINDLKKKNFILKVCRMEHFLGFFIKRANF